MSDKYAVYADTWKSIKPCVSAPSCSVHKHRPRPAPCPDPDTCYKACIRRKEKCPSAMETVNPRGTPCECARIQSQSSRLANNVTVRTHRARIKKAYATRSQISRWKNPNLSSEDRKKASRRGGSKGVSKDGTGGRQKKGNCVIL